MADNNPENLVILSGCSGGGKSTLLLELKHRGFQVAPEAGRRVVKQALRTGEDVLPWNNPAGFAKCTTDLAVLDYETARNRSDLTFFDRSPLDLAAHLNMLALPLPENLSRAVESCKYEKTVFMTPPWPQIFHKDEERQKSFEEAVREYEYLVRFYEQREYQPHLLPRVPVSERADHILGILGFRSDLSR